MDAASVGYILAGVSVGWVLRGVFSDRQEQPRCVCVCVIVIALFKGPQKAPQVACGLSH